MKEVKRQWGVFKQFVLNKKCTVKIIEVNPHQELSLQVHKKRVEKWYFLTPGIVQLGNKKIKIRRNQMIIIKRNSPHRVIAEKERVKFLEISLGDFSESDEIRLEDKYGRK